MVKFMLLISLTIFANTMHLVSHDMTTSIVCDQSPEAAGPE